LRRIVAAIAMLVASTAAVAPDGVVGLTGTDAAFATSDATR
jgi:hypothetical protein